jgi:hypothetical protein
MNEISVEYLWNVRAGVGISVEFLKGFNGRVGDRGRDGVKRVTINNCPSFCRSGVS